MTTPDDNWRLLWAKTDRDHTGQEDYDPTWTRPLWAHLLDVGHTAHLLWEQVVPNALRHRAADALGMTDDEAGSWLSFWIGLHDLGKAIPSFQFQDEQAPYLERMREDGFTLRGASVRGPHHGHATISILYREMADGDAQPAFMESLSAFVGFHHGRLTDVEAWRGDAVGDDRLGGADWRRAQRDLLHTVYATWNERYGLSKPSPDIERVPDWLLGIAGWATLADWLGSLAQAFPGKGDDSDPGCLGEPAAYLNASRAGAARALRLAGFDAPAAVTARPFADLFPSLSAYSLRPVQQALLDLPLPQNPDASTLTIVEAPTGEGKTEAALAFAARQQDRRARDRDGDLSRGGGLYLALPTQATANGLLGRATDFLTHAHTGPVASFRLAYGRSELHPESEALLADHADLSALYDESDGPGAETRVRTLRWFTGRKRALLTPYGLGTIDQALLGVLYSRHFFLRLFGLAGKTVVVDEVHAYDVYMNALVRRLLPWLRALGTHVILLSATLPARTRRELIAAWDPDAALPDDPEPQAVGYPAVWSASEGTVQRRAGVDDGLTASRTQRCALERADPDPATVAQIVADAVNGQAAVAVVCNTVQRAQDVFQAIQQELGDALSPDDLVLFHARFVRRERQRIEDRVLTRFGKGRASGPAVLVGTQVIEQSLDLDVDMMVSDLAPIDLLLQRAGRLHRHDRERPLPPANAPRLVWLCPDWDADALPDVTDLSGYGHVYARTVLWRTARLLRDRTGWSLPHDYRPLIEAVYDASSEPDGLVTDAATRWSEAEAREQAAQTQSEREAERRKIPLPSQLWRLIASGQHELADDDDETAHASLRAMTREGESIEVVVLHENNGALFLDPALTLAAPLALSAPDKALGTESVRALLGASVRLSQKRFVKHIQNRDDNESPDAWSRAAATTPSLTGLHPIVMQDGVWDGAGRAVRWHDTLGLIVETS